MIKLIPKCLIILCLLVTGCSSKNSSKLELMDVFSDGMVLQQKSKSKIWGKSNPNSTINIEGTWGIKLSIESDQYGNWIDNTSRRIKSLYYKGHYPRCELV